MSLVTLYHGQKGYDGSNEITSFHFDPYVYLTDNYNYAQSYSKSNSVYDIKINSETLLDCTELGGNKTYFVFVQNFLKKKGIFISYEFKQLFDGSYPEYAFWQMVRIDSKGRLMNQLVSKGYNGIIIIEESKGRFYKSYVLFNEKTIINIMKHENLVEKILKESKQNYL